MKTINYITYDSWWDTDRTILPVLSEEYSINIIVVSPETDKKYPSKEKFGGGEFVEIVQQYRDRDIRSVRTIIETLHSIIKVSDRKGDLFWFIPGQNPLLQLLLYMYLPVDKTIITFHNYTPHLNGKKSNLGNGISWLYTKIKDSICTKFNKFLFYSEIQSQNFKKDYSQKTVAVCNMPLKDFGVYHKKEHKERAFLFFGVIQEYKRLDLFVEAAIRCESERCKFIIAGRPTYDCKDILDKTKKIKNIQCDIHFIKDDDVLGYFEKADFLVLPYMDSTQSGPLLIALNYGIPVICSDLPVFRNFITNGVNGFLFKSGDVDSLVESYDKASCLSDEELRMMESHQLAKGKEYSKNTNPLIALQKLF